MKAYVKSGGETHSLACRPGENVAECLARAGLLKRVECGRGVCGKCAIKLVSGALAQLGKDAGGEMTGPCEALACRCVFGTGDVIIEADPAEKFPARKAHLPALGADFLQGEPLIRKVFLKLPPPEAGDERCDSQRLCAALGAHKIHPDLEPRLSSLLREADFAVTAAMAGDEIMAVEAGDRVAENYGFVVDIGTTTLAVYLIDLARRELVLSEGAANPQAAFGADVLTRIGAAGESGGLKKLQEAVLQGIAAACRRLLAESGAKPENVYAMTVVGNTVMSHFFLGLDPSGLAAAPFRPAFGGGRRIAARELSLPLNPAAAVHVLPNISSHVGSDMLGVIMAVRPWEKAGYSLAVDVGTNGEIMLASPERIYVCSAAAGPAFEGAHIECGMRAAAGAIEKVSLCGEKPVLGVIGGVPPRGLCGSGLIDAVAELLRAGLLDREGRFALNSGHPMAGRLRAGKGGMREFVLAYQGEAGAARDITLTQKDVREFQMAKAAIAAGIDVLCAQAGISGSAVERLYLAGSFGNYLDIEKASALGLFSAVSADKIIPVGNAAALGAGRCLLSSGELRKAEETAAAVQAEELGGREDFNEIWLNRLDFPAPAQKSDPACQAEA